MSRCDIIIPVWNQEDDTKHCIDSIKRNTGFPYRLIIIDNASSHNTRTYLKTLEESDPENIKLIRKETNCGFIKAVNEGVALSNSEFVCILNNDTLVSPGWLSEMISLFEKDNKIGIVNPSSNTLGQHLTEGETLEKRAEDIRRERGLYVALGNAFGFCMLIKRKLFDEIGLFDEGYGMGYFEDTDFSLRANQKGYKAVRALGSYVYHSEKKSFKLLKNFEDDFEKNKRAFESKWGKTERVMAVMKNTDRKALLSLDGIIKKHAKPKSWVYVISPRIETRAFFERYSNLTFYHPRRLIYLNAFLKILFKKKKPDLVYGDNRAFLKSMNILNKIISIKTKQIEEIGVK